MQHITHVETAKKTGVEGSKRSSRGKEWKDETLRKGRRVWKKKRNDKTTREQ